MSKLLDLIEKNAIKQARFSNTSNTMSSSSSSSSSGISFTGALTVLFVGLKLTNVITWSWWWVLSPIWISLSLAVVVIAIAVIIAIIAESFK